MLRDKDRCNAQCYGIRISEPEIPCPARIILAAPGHSRTLPDTPGHSRILKILREPQSHNPLRAGVAPRAPPRDSRGIVQGDSRGVWIRGLQGGLDMAGVYAYPGGGTPGRDHLGAGAAPSQKQEIFGPAYPLDWSRRYPDLLILCVPSAGTLGAH